MRRTRATTDAAQGWRNHAPERSLDRRRASRGWLAMALMVVAATPYVGYMFLQSITAERQYAITNVRDNRARFEQRLKRQEQTVTRLESPNEVGPRALALGLEPPDGAEIYVLSDPSARYGDLVARGAEPTGAVR